MTTRVLPIALVAVLGLVVTDHVFRTYPDLPEGEPTEASSPEGGASAEGQADPLLDQLLVGLAGRPGLARGAPRPEIRTNARRSTPAHRRPVATGGGAARRGPHYLSTRSCST